MDSTFAWLHQNKDKDIYGRVCSGSIPKEPLKSLAYNRETAFLFGPDALKNLPSTPYEFYLQLGFQEHYIYDDIVRTKTPQKLILFELNSEMKNGMYPIVSASWDGVSRFLELEYPTIYPDFKRHEQELRTRPFKELEDEAGFSFYAALKSLDPKLTFINENEYLNYPEPRTAWQLRAFLYCEFRLLELFTGDGNTLSASGAIGVKEYLAKNVAIDHLRSLTNVFEDELDVIIPEEVLVKFE